MPKKPLALSPVSAPGAFRLKIERARCHLGIDEIVAMAMESGSLSEWTNSCNFWLLLVRSFFVFFMVLFIKVLLSAIMNLY